MSQFFGACSRDPEAWPTGRAWVESRALRTAPNQGSAAATIVASSPGTCIAAAIDTHRSDALTIAVGGTPRWRDVSNDSLTGNHSARVAAAYRRYGRDFLARLGGGFVIALHDAEQSALLLAVDRMGIGRITYAESPGGVYFASSARAVAHAPDIGVAIDLQSLFDYLFFHMVPSPRTIYSRVHKLPPASYLEYRTGKCEIRRYWQPTFAQPGTTEPGTLDRELLISLEAGVRDSDPDAATGAFLSGGLDSSAVSGILARMQPRPRTFSIGFETEGFDELEYARIAVRHFDCDAIEYVATANDVVNLVPLIARAYDEPFGNASALPTLCCARLAKSHGVDHLLAGDGGDELFAGNSRYVDQQVFERYADVPRVIRRAVLEPILSRLPSLLLRVDLLRRATNYIAQANTPLPRRLETWNLLSRLGIANLLEPEFLAAIDPEAPLRHMDMVYAESGQAATVDKMMFYDWRFTLADNDLRKVESMCELAGVRVSYPMLDNAVIDLSTRVPPDEKIAGGRLRDYYKRAMKDFLPPEIINKKKHGFGLPFGLWLRDSASMQELFFGALSRLRALRIIRADVLDNLRRLNADDEASYYGVMIWVLALLEQWFEQHKIAP